MMGVLDIFKKKQKELDLPPPPPPELLNQEMPQEQIELPPLPDLPPLEIQIQEPLPDPKSYEIPSLETEEFPLPPIEVMPKREVQVKSVENQRVFGVSKQSFETDESKQLQVIETIPKKDAPVFVKIDEYRNILENINMIRTKVNESDYVIEALGDLRSKIESEFEKWREDLEEMQAKLVHIDKVVFEDKAKT